MKKIKMPYWIFGVAVVIVAAALIVGLMDDSDVNVILISIDTLRADHLGCYGYERATSPSIDKLSSEAVRFTSTYSETSWTLPAHMSMVTSQYPHVHGVEKQTQSLAQSKTTLAEVLSQAGYHTSAFISWIYVSRKYGFAKGFDEFTELLPPLDKIDLSTSASYKAEKVTNEAIDWLKKMPKKPFFLFVHYFDPHISYEPPPPYNSMFDPDYKGQANGTYQWLKRYIKGRNPKPKTIDPCDLQHIIALYDGEIRYTDTHVGRLLEAADTTVGLDNCLVIIVGDHGEEMNEHGSMEGHQWTLYNEVVHVPLILRFPKKIHAGMVVDKAAGLIDIAPTIADFLGIAKPAQFQGQSLMGMIDGQGQEKQEHMIFAETRRNTVKQSARRGRYKLIHNAGISLSKKDLPELRGYEMFDIEGTYEMYDLEADPKEQENIYDASSAVTKMLISELNSWKQSGPKTRDKNDNLPEVELTPAEIERLRSLGYVD